jgi:hypothetical protein
VVADALSRPPPAATQPPPPSQRPSPNSLLPTRDGRENRQGVHTLPESGPDTSRYGASQAAGQVSPR